MICINLSIHSSPPRFLSLRLIDGKLVITASRYKGYWNRKLIDEITKTFFADHEHSFNALCKELNQKCITLAINRNFGPCEPEKL
jgi:hypothetical protein